MNEIESLLERNKRIAARNSAEGKTQFGLGEALPNVKAIVIGCADMRADPVDVLGLEPGEAVVMRNIGGRVTPGLLAQLGMLGQIGQAEGKVPGDGGEFNIIVMQHTDCGIKRLAKETAMLTQYFQVPEGEVAAKTVTDPRAAVATDVAVLRSVPGLPSSWLLSRLVYDLETGLVETVVSPAPVAG